MAISPQHRITTSGQSNGGRYLSGSQHQDWMHLYPPEMLNKQFNMWTIISREIQRKGHHHYIKARCACGKEDWKCLDNLKSGKSTMCHRCATKNRHRREGNLDVTSKEVGYLQNRATAIFQRCNNPNDKGYKRYGARGITCEFDSVKDLVEYLITLAPAKDWIGNTIDRIDNNKGYMRGNLRCISPSGNNANRRNTVFVSYRGQKVCIGHVWHLIRHDNPQFTFGNMYTQKILRRGMTPEEVLNKPRVGNRRSTTLSMPDPAIVSLYREC